MKLWLCTISLLFLFGCASYKQAVPKDFFKRAIQHIGLFKILIDKKFAQVCIYPQVLGLKDGRLLSENPNPEDCKGGLNLVMEIINPDKKTKH